MFGSVALFNSLCLLGTGKPTFLHHQNHWKYALINGETGLLKTLEEPMHLVKKLDKQRFLVFNETQKVFEVECP